MPVLPTQVRVPVDGVTVPEPVPDFVTVRIYKILKVAVTFLAWVMETVQVPVPEHPSPDQPAKLESEAAEAVKITLVPEI